MARKKPVFWNRTHITRLADALFPTLLKEVGFPLHMNDRIGLCKRAEAIQLTCFTEEERGVITTERREKLIAALNYRYRRHMQAVEPVAADPAVVATEPAAAKPAFTITVTCDSPEHLKSIMGALATVK